MTAVRDRFGIAYRPPLAASVWTHAEQLDLIEVIADDWFGASSWQLSALSALARRIPTQLHAVGLGLASTGKVDVARVSALARVVDAVGDGTWSEHLAFVRSRGIELGHLCAPPRTWATLDGLARNVRLARAIVGSAPALENVATLIDPPASELDEATFVSAALKTTGCGWLLDLHNLHANAQNYGFDARTFLDRVPLHRVATVHLAGGHRIRVGAGTRVLDDHRHAVPSAVFALLETLAARAAQRLDVIVEYDGEVPSWDAYLAEIALARSAVARGRARAAARSASAKPVLERP